MPLKPQGTSASIGVVYGTASGIVRRIIVPDDAAELLRAGQVGPGESMMTLPRPSATGAVSMLSSAKTAVADSLGLSSVPSGRCVVVDKTGLVVDCIMADPAIDSISGFTLVSSDVAGPGWRLQDGVLIEPPDAPKHIATKP